MENASKALIMAGSVLITIIIISLFILMANGLTSYKDVNNQVDKSDYVAQFNSQYEKYNRDSVRGSDLISLANKVIDYNKRKSTAGTDNVDGGAEVGYYPMILTIKMGKNDAEAQNNLKNLIRYKETGYTPLLTESTYTASGTTHTLDSFLETTKDIEERYKNSEALTKFVSGITKIFIGDGIDGSDYTVADENQKKDMIKAINNFNTCYGKKVLDSDPDNETKFIFSWKTLWGWSGYSLKDGTKIISTNVKQDIYQYYEYVLFKRGNFKCTKCETRNDTGRIYDMEFVFTGEFNMGESNL